MAIPTSNHVVVDVKQSNYSVNNGCFIDPQHYHQLQQELQKTKEMLNVLLINGAHSASTSMKQTVIGDNGWSRSVSTNYSIINNKSKSLTIRKSVEQEIMIPMDQSLHEKQLQEQLQQSKRELSRYKFRVKQLEEQNSKMSMQLLSITDGAESFNNSMNSSTPSALMPSKFSPKQKIPENDRDSDDSMDETEVDHIPAEQDLDDKKDNWAAYLESFDDRGSEEEIETPEYLHPSEHENSKRLLKEVDVPIDSRTEKEFHAAGAVVENDDYLDYFYPSSETDDKATKRTVLGLSQVDEASIVTNPMLHNKKKNARGLKPLDREIAFSHVDVYNNKEDDILSNLDYSVNNKLNPHSSRDKDKFEEVSPLHLSKPKAAIKSLKAREDRDTNAESEAIVHSEKKSSLAEELVMESNPLHQSRVVGAKTTSSESIQTLDSKLDTIPMETNPLRISRSKESLLPLVSHNNKSSKPPNGPRSSIPPQLQQLPTLNNTYDDDSDDESSVANSSLGLRGARMVSNVDDSDNEDSDNEDSQEPVSPNMDVWDDQNPEELIFELIGMNTADLVDQLLGLAPKVVRAVDSDGRSPLHVAAQRNMLDIVRLLISINAPLDAIDQFGKSPMHYTRDPNIAELLAEEGANVNIQDNDGITPLLEYCREECHDCVKAVLPYGADPMLCDGMQRRHCLHVATLLGSYELLMILSTESTVPINVDKPDQDGFTALHFAASGDRETGEQLKILMLLLDKGAQVKMGNMRGVTALHLICANRMLSRLSLAEPMVEMLLSCGAHPNMQDADGCTPLIVSVAYREWNLCKHLLEGGGDLNIPCSMSSTFLQGGNGVVDIGLTTSNYDKKTLELMATSDCTASDLLPKTPRYKLFAYIRVLQTRIPGDTRDRCMNCANPFNQSSYFRISSGKHHCRHCNRVVCQTCSPNEVPRHKLPAFVQNAYSESSMRICVVCYAVLIEMKDEE
jgi:ankyrin repeat protein